MCTPAQGQAPSDHGDIYYVRSTDNGSTWSTPIKLNDDPGGQYKTQWMPSLSVNYNLAGFQPRGQGYGFLVRPPPGHHRLQRPLIRDAATIATASSLPTTA